MSDDIEPCRGESDAWFCVGDELREEIGRLRAENARLRATIAMAHEALIRAKSTDRAKARRALRDALSDV